VSLIFEALKKLDREKKAPERGFLVVGGAPLPGRRMHLPALVLLLAAAGGGGFLIARATRPAPPVAAPATTPTAPPLTVRTLAPPAPLPPEAAAVPTVVPDLPSASVAPVASAPQVTAPPASAPAAPAPAFALQAVADQDGHPVAIVNGQLVRVGDQVDGARVVRIDPEEVELDQGGRRLVLTF
jgi:hypothetical protein